MPRGRPREFDREEVLEKAMALFWAQGFEATGVSQLEERTGLGRQSLYNAFGDKHALYLEVLKHYGETRLQRVLDILWAPGDALERVRELVRAWGRLEGDECRLGCLFANSAAEFGDHDRETSEVIRRNLMRQEEALYHALRRAQLAGELGKGANPRGMARMLVATGQGMSLLRRAGMEQEVLDDVVATTLMWLDRG